MPSGAQSSQKNQNLDHRFDDEEVTAKPMTYDETRKLSLDINRLTKEKNRGVSLILKRLIIYILH